MPPTAVRLHGCRNPLATTERFSVGLAQTLEDVIGCQRLRYLIFYCELGRASIAPRGAGWIVTSLISSVTI
jgi:hypothetical protein